ncbi:PSME3-interacting protein-like isoform X2 [Paramacrobiotus metropolitanus]|uniref:PSME3-interacting protein-like isoform X2 n=1 Tax=Paramacrobiotus metropolitanus TaxID=2943436 RepID=UPI0024459473|nr:PSME3-interacting protein-like isoform X2 [Paramacrobiotus metropolitanus]
MSFAAPKETFKSFVTEKEIEEKKKVRQAEWEKVRKPDQPLQAPDEPVDNRTLYDRLKEQKLKEQEEKEEARKLKNFVRGLEHDEVEFLDQRLSKQKLPRSLESLLA